MIDFNKSLLVNWNWAMFALHGATALLVLFTADMSLHVNTYKVTWGRSNGTAGAAWVVPEEGVVDRVFPIAWATAGFSILSALFSFGNAWLWRTYYLRGISVCRCRSRWVEYSLSAPLVAVCIAWVTSTVYSDALLCIFALISTTMFFGELCEDAARPVSEDEWSVSLLPRLKPHLLGWVPFVVAFAVVLQNFANTAAIKFVLPSGEEVGMPDFVPYLVLVQVLAFTSFAFVQLVVVFVAPKHYWKGELAYQILSLLSKSILSIMLIGNVIGVSIAQETQD